MPLWNVRLTPTPEEWREGLRISKITRPKPWRLALQTVVLTALFLWALVAYIAERAGGSLFIAVAAAVLLAVMWLAPAVRERALIKEVCEGPGAGLWVYEDGVSFGGEPREKAQIPFSQMRILRGEKILALVFSGKQLVVAPRRQLTDEEWESLCARSEGE